MPPAALAIAKAHRLTVRAAKRDLKTTEADRLDELLHSEVSQVLTTEEA